MQGCISFDHGRQTLRRQSPNSYGRSRGMLRKLARSSASRLPLFVPFPPHWTPFLHRKRLHQSPESTLSLEGLRCVFLCGLTLLHAVQVDRKALPLSTLQRAIRAESNTLFAYAGAYRGANAYGEVFGELADAVLDNLARGEEAGPPIPPPNLQPAVATPLFQSLWDDIPSMMSAFLFPSSFVSTSF